METGLKWIGAGVIVILAVVGLFSVFGFRTHAGDGYAGVSWQQTGCCSSDDHVSPAEERFLRRVYK